MQPREMIARVLRELNDTQRLPVVLKGGTALMLCYGLDRFSEDIDFDSPGESYSRTRDLFLEALERYCSANDCVLRKAKDTPSVQRVFIHQDSHPESRPLKIEVSYRNNTIATDKYHTVEDLKVYRFGELCRQKAAAYLGRDKIRDLYDLTYIITHHSDDPDDLMYVSSSALDLARKAFEYRDLEQFDYLVSTQDDPLIDTDVLETRFLTCFETLGLLAPRRGQDFQEATF